MTPTLDTLFAQQPELIEQIRAQDRALALELLERFTRPLPSGEPFDWAVANLILDTPTIKGQPFNAVGREYLRDPINDINADDCREQTCCWGTGNAKTLKNIVQATWAMEHAPFSGLFILPSKEGPGGGRQFNNGSLIPTIERTPCFAGKIPTGADRHNFSGLHLQFAGNNIDLAGANSPTQLGAKRCQYVWLDEQDKYKAKLGREEGADYLAGERTKQVPNAKIIRGSTPTREDVGIWPHLMRSDLRRRFLTCPHCNAAAARNDGMKGWFVLVKDEQYTVLPSKFADGTTIPLAPLRWDKEAKRQDGTWDIERVIRSARFECPHCQGHIMDHHRIWLDQRGLWLPTRSAIGHKGYHLSSFYAPHIDTETSWGHMAKKFLDKQESGEMQGYINSDLAEVHVSQEHTGRESFNVQSRENAGSESWLPILSVDNQQNFPYRWFIVRRFLVSVLRPVRNQEQQSAFDAKLDADQVALVKKILNATEPDPQNILCPHRILGHLQRTDHWPRLAEWLVGNNLIGRNLSTFFQIEFQTDLMRLIEFICRQKEVNIKPGRPGDSELLEAGFGDLWEDVDEVQQRHRVSNINVIVDAKWNTGEVSAECFRRCPDNAFCFYHPFLKKYMETPDRTKWNFARAGWTPVFGFEKAKTWRDARGISFPYTTRPEDMLDDPFKGQHNSNRFYHHVFKFNAQWSLSELARVRKRNAFTISDRCRWTPQEGENRGGVMTHEEYLRHMRGYFWDERRQIWDAPGKHGGSQSRRNPNHLYDCEKNAIAWAASKGIFRTETQNKTKTLEPVSQ